MPGDIKAKYLASVTLASTGLDALAASSTLVAGYETNAVNVTTISGGPPTDILLSGQFKAAAANHSAGQIEVWVIGAENDTPSWPDLFDGTASAETVSSRNVLFGCGRMAAMLFGDSANDRIYTFAPISVASLFGGVLPTHFVVFVTHNIQSTTSAWGTGDNFIYYTPVLGQYT